jgi:hypothetical protein
VKVQNIDFVPAHNVKDSTLGKLSNSDKLCNDSDNSTQPLQVITKLLNTQEQQTATSTTQAHL